jgi:PIN domain nuclease of toxin-antitoxin system
MYLLDTHAMLWYLRDSPELSASAHSLIDKAEYVAVSIASFWEIAIKQSIGKMQFCMTIPELESLCLDQDIQVLPIQSIVLEQIKALPKIHGDPFDRLIIAQAQIGKMTIITRDRMIPQYPVPTIW